MAKPKKQWIIRKDGNARGIGIIGGADGPTAVFVGGKTPSRDEPILRFVKAVGAAAGVAAAICLSRGRRGR